MGVAPVVALGAALKPLLPSTWLLVTSEKNLETMSKITVVLHQQRIAPLPAAPMGAHTVSIVAQIISPLDDRERAERQLDDPINAFVHVLDENGFAWTSAEKVSTEDGHLAYDVTIDVTSTKE
jgi:hypothetical protein